MKHSVYAKMRLPLLLALLTAALTGAQSQAPARFVGSITGITAKTVTVKSDTGDQRQFDVPDSAVLKRIEPGEKDLSKAAAITFSELAVGDRILVKLDPSASAATPQAAQIIAIKAQDLAQKQQNDREAWQRNGVAGLVKTVDPGAGAIALTTGAGVNTKLVNVHITKSTILKRYAAGSVNYDQAQPGPIDAIHPGDQLRARGTKNPDGNEIYADEIVSGTFRNIAGTITSLDPATSTMVVKDLATKKPVTIHVTADAQMRRLPERMAQMLAARLKGGSGAGPGGPPQSAGGGAPPSGGPAPGAPGGGQRSWNGAASGSPGAQGSGDPQQMLNRVPAIQFSDLQKGQAVMLVSTEGTGDVTAITLLAGVEPLLEAPSATNLLSNWSMGSGGGGEGGGAATP